MFDPFRDFQTAGYLRNVEGLQDLAEVKIQEHAFFEANLDDALAFLASRSLLDYGDFLSVHRILFGEFYPWAGQDRRQLGVGRLVGKGVTLQFEVAELCQRAVEWGLQLGHDPARMRRTPGEVMGAFAWGHPFLDGNGRTMLLVHAELCRRAGFAINWLASHKTPYLQALSLELEHPGRGHLDRYLLPYVVPLTPDADPASLFMALPGLDGALQSDLNRAYLDDDAAALARYLELKRQRGSTSA